MKVLLLPAATLLILAACGGSATIGPGAVFEYVPSGTSPGIYVVAATQAVASYFQQTGQQLVDNLPSDATQASCVTSDFTVYIDASMDPSLSDIQEACSDPG